MSISGAKRLTCMPEECQHSTCLCVMYHQTLVGRWQVCPSKWRKT